MTDGSHLASAQLLDCEGRVTHELVLLPDGRVEVRTANVLATVDPTTGVVHPRGCRLPDEVVRYARTLAREIG